MSAKRFGIGAAFFSLLVVAAALFCEWGSSYIELPVKFERSNLPYVDVVIDKKVCPLVVDLGSRLDILMHADVLNQLHKSPFGQEKWKNFLGEVFEQNAFRLPEIELGSLRFNDPVVVEESPQNIASSTIWNDPNNKDTARETVGGIGRGLLDKRNILFDLEHSKIVFSNNLRKLKKSGYPIQSYIKVPFSMESKGMVVEVSTDFRKLRLLIDSGTTWTILHEYLFPEGIEKKVSPYGFPEIVSSTFDMGPAHFGEQRFYFMPMGEELKDIDGFIGMDFIKKHVMYIDFDHKVLYIQA
ncbi:MAG: hypothetical protein KDK71_07385 [Chlamydiia bacterium]|nr:hypothetical protein [Chlamydiia bacterium]